MPEQNSAESLSCSGVYMGKGIVLTHGTIITDVLRDKRAELLLQELKLKGCVLNRKKTDLLNTILQDTQSSFRIILPSEQMQDEINDVYCNSRGAVASRKDNRGYLHNIMSLEDHYDQFKRKDLSSLIPADRLKSMSSDISEIIAPSSTSKVASSNYCSLPAIVERLIVQPGIRESIATIMPSSQGWKLEEKECDPELESLILSTFVLLKIFPDDRDSDMIMEATLINEDVINITERMIPLVGFSQKGTSVYVESSPFGSLSPSVFLNSLSHGIISNVSNSPGDILLTDARCVMGSEGAPVFTMIGGKKCLCGMVISPFCWRDGEWLGLTLLASAKPILQVLLDSVNIDIDTENREIKESDNQDKLVDIESSTSKLDVELNGVKEHKADVPVGHQKIIKNSGFTLKERYLNQGIDYYINGSVVAVCSGGGWGSGIVISTSPGIILTCAHVTHPATSGNVQIVLSGGESLTGQVIHQTQPRTLNLQSSKNGHGSCTWDLAVVLTAGPLPLALPLASQLPPKGSPVIVAGYGIFSHKCLPTPTVSQGVVSKLISFPVHTLHWPSHQGLSRVSQIPAKDMDKHSSNMVVKRVHDDIWNHDEKNLTCGTSIKLSNGYQGLPTSALYRKPDDAFLDVECMDGHVLVNNDDSGMVPMIMQTTCAVYAGTSGGPVVSFHPQYGLQVIGVIVCNTRDTASKAAFPHINMAVPTPAIFKILKAFISSGDKMVLRYLDAECAAASHLWTLGLVPQSRL